MFYRSVTLYYVICNSYFSTAAFMSLHKSIVIPNPSDIMQVFMHIASPIKLGCTERWTLSIHKPYAHT